jgi:hypothetical protein
VFVCMRLLESGQNLGFKRDTTSFDSLTNQLDKHIKAGDVKSRAEATVPKIGWVRGPTAVTAGKSFEVEITLADRGYFGGICCDNGVS